MACSLLAGVKLTDAAWQPKSMVKKRRDLFQGTVHCAGVVISWLRPGEGVRGTMSIASEILKLRNDHTSSVSLLLGAIEWAQATKNHDTRVMRSHAIKQAADLVIINVAVYAQETQNEPPVGGNRRAISTPRRSRRRFDPGTLLYQRRLFA